MADEFSSNDLLSTLLRRMDLLEANNVGLATENNALRERMESLERNVLMLQCEAEDAKVKLAVVRQNQQKNAALRVFGITELLERILIYCPPKQLFHLQNVCHTFRAAILGLAKIQTITFSSPKDVVLPSIQLPARRQLHPPLKLNPFFAERWKSPSPDCSAITFEVSSSSWLNPTYWIRPDLSATFTLRVGTSHDFQSALKRFDTPLGRTYLTQPGLPTSIRATFTDTSRSRHRNDYGSPWQSSTFLPKDVTAIVEVAPTTLLNMMRIAGMLERYHSLGEKDWGGSDVGWAPKSATEVEREVLRVVRHSPSYSR